MMIDQTFRDYYKILQVHYDASSEIIKTAYEKLLEVYASDPETSRALTEAYDILSDSRRRSIYHKEWLTNFTERAQFFQGTPRPYHKAPDDAGASAEEVMDDFFHALYLKDWQNAYKRLTRQDRSIISFDEFQEWRTAICNCYEMQEYRLSYVTSHESITLDTLTYHKIAEFQVSITDLDEGSREISTDLVRKFASLENGIWTVCLGINNIRSSTLKYRSLAASKNQQESLAAQYSSSRLDPLTGLLSEVGFMEDASREVARNHRYHNPFTLLSFQISCEDKERESSCLIHLAEIISHACRSTDLAARLNNNQIICLLTETEQEKAEAAARKFLRLIRENPSETYSVSFGMILYNGFSSLSDAILACCHMAGLPSHY